MITFPDGKRMLIDCGSLGHANENIKDILFGASYLHNAKQIDLLVLTHEDNDHHNMLYDMLYDEKEHRPLLPVKTIYFGGDLKGYGKINTKWFLTNYYEKSSIKSIFFPLNPKDNRSLIKMTTQKHPERQEVFDQPWDAVLTGQKNGASYKVAILASNVGIYKKEDIQEYNDSGITSGTAAMKINTKSVVTLITLERGGNTTRILVGGDATFHTEKYLLERYPAALLSHIDYLRVSHHGSESSSSQKYVNLTSPKRIIISAAYADHKYCIPRKVIVEKWREVSNFEMPKDHWLYYWMDASDAMSEDEKGAINALEDMDDDFSPEPEVIRTFKGYSHRKDSIREHLRITGSEGVSFEYIL